MYSCDLHSQDPMEMLSNCMRISDHPNSRKDELEKSISENFQIKNLKTSTPKDFKDFVKSLKILYIYPHEPQNFVEFLSGFIRMSNHLNSRKDELEGLISEQYLDLRFENLPEFTEEKIEIYREELRILLKKIYDEFNFDVVAILCYSSFKYINSVEIASVVKRFINPKCVVVVGGPHPTLCPEEFQLENLPDYFYHTFPRNETPFDFVVKEEGEIPFFKLIRGILNGSVIKRKSLTESCRELGPEIMANLDDLPIIDYELFKKYSKDLEKFGQVNLEFTRGCHYRCKMCVNSTNRIACYKNVRIKSIDRCIQELRAIRDTKWLSIKSIYISDMIFLPGSRYRNEFFKKFQKLKDEGFPFHIRVNDRIEVCSKQDLKYYKKFNFTPHFGFESASKTLLKRMGKVPGRTDKKIDQNVDKYLRKVEKIIKIVNILDLDVNLNYMLLTPGSDLLTYEENRHFLLGKRFNGKSLVEKYNVNLWLGKYHAYFGHKLYEECEEVYGGQIFYKKWWRMFVKNQRLLCVMVDPSSELSLKEGFKLEVKIMAEIFKIQMKRKNKFFSLVRLLELKMKGEEILKLLET